MERSRSPRGTRSRRVRPASFDPSVSRFVSEVRESLHLALASASDPRLFSVSVLDVRVEPGHGPLIVVISAPVSMLDDTRSALAGAKGRLRSEVAAALQRKRAPDLSFVVVSIETSDEEDEDAW